MLSNFYLTQSALKDLEKTETCPFRWKKQWMDKEIQSKSTEAMDKGSYFEQLILGAGATGTIVSDLPRLKNGDKSTDQIRIDQQAERVSRMLFDVNDPEFLGFNIIHKQLEIKVGNKKGTYDIVAEQHPTNIPWILDLKLCKDATSDYSEYGWGNDWTQLDLVQLVHYQDIYTEFYGIRPKTGLIVVDYSPQKRVIFGEINISDEKRSEKNIRFNAAEEAITMYEAHGWSKVPAIKECEGCPLTCSSRLQGSKLIKKFINY